jgi:hypothetical protein
VNEKCDLDNSSDEDMEPEPKVKQALNFSDDTLAEL